MANQEKINSLFIQLSKHLLDIPGSSEYLKNIQPSHYDLDTSEWKLKLDGFASALQITGVISSVQKAQVNEITGFAKEALSDGERPDRTNKYSIDIETIGADKYQFDVPATNPLDAYAQFTKRIAYRSIPDIIKVAVYTNFVQAREITQTAQRCFEKDDLIYANPFY